MVGEKDVVTVVFKEMVGSGAEEKLPTTLARQCLVGSGFSVDDTDMVLGDKEQRPNENDEWALVDVLNVATVLKKQGKWSIEGNIAAVPLTHVLVWVKVYASLAAGGGDVTAGALRSVLTSGPQPLTSGAWSDVCPKKDNELLSLCDFLQICRVF